MGFQSSRSGEVQLSRQAMWSRVRSFDRRVPGAANDKALDLSLGVLLHELPRIPMEWKESRGKHDCEVKRKKRFLFVSPSDTRGKPLPFVPGGRLNRRPPVSF